jgi:hypothetical protein
MMMKNDAQSIYDSLKKYDEKMKRLEKMNKKGEHSCDKKSKKKPKKCCICSRQFVVMMSMRTAEVIDGREKKEKYRWFCPSCMSDVLDSFDRLKVDVELNRFKLKG